MAHATNQTGRFVLVEQWRSAERSLAPGDRPLELLRKWGEHAKDVRFILKSLDETGRVLTTVSHSENDPPYPSGLSKPYFVAATGPTPESGTLRTEQHYRVNPMQPHPPGNSSNETTIIQRQNRTEAQFCPNRLSSTSTVDDGLSVMSTSAYGTLNSKRNDLNRSIAGSELSFRDSHNISQASIQSSATTDTSASGASVVRSGRTQRRAVSAGFLSKSSTAMRPPTYEQAMKRTKLLASPGPSGGHHSMSLGRRENHNTKFPPGREEVIAMIRLQIETLTNQTDQLRGVDSSEFGSCRSLNFLNTYSD